MRIEKRLNPFFGNSTTKIIERDEGGSDLNLEKPTLFWGKDAQSIEDFQEYSQGIPPLIKIRCNLVFKASPVLRAQFSMDKKIFDEAIFIPPQHKKMMRSVEIFFCGEGSFLAKNRWHPFFKEKITETFTLSFTQKFQNQRVYSRKFSVFEGEEGVVQVRATKESKKFRFNLTETLDTIPILPVGCIVGNNFTLKDIQQHFITVRRRDEQTTIQSYTKEDLMQQGINFDVPNVQTSKILGNCQIIHSGEKEAKISCAYDSLEDDLTKGGASFHLTSPHKEKGQRFISCDVQQVGKTPFVDITFKKTSEKENTK